MMSQRTEVLYRAHRPGRRRNGFPISLADLVDEVEASVKVGMSKADLCDELGINEELLDSLLQDIQPQVV